MGRGVLFEIRDTPCLNVLQLRIAYSILQFMMTFYVIFTHVIFTLYTDYDFKFLKCTTLLLSILLLYKLNNDCLWVPSQVWTSCLFFSGESSFLHWLHAPTLLIPHRVRAVKIMDGWMCLELSLVYSNVTNIDK